MYPFRPLSPSTPVQVLEHSSMAIRLSEPGAAAEAYHLHGGALKDLGRLQEAEEVSCALLFIVTVLHMSILRNIILLI